MDIPDHLKEIAEIKDLIGKDFKLEALYEIIKILQGIEEKVDQINKKFK